MPKTIFMNLQASINQESASKLLGAVEAALRNGMTQLHLMIASPGGGVDAGMAIYNFLRGIPAEVSTYNYGSVDSVATVVYCSGSRRLVTPHCKFLLHGVTWSYPPSPQGHTVSEVQLEESLGQLKVLKQNIANVLSEATKRPIGDVIADMNRTLSLDAKGAMAYGLAHDVTTQLLPSGVDVVPIR